MMSINRNNQMTVVKDKDAKRFIQDFNKNKVSKEFLESCEKAGKLFGEKKKK